MGGREQGEHGEGGSKVNECGSNDVRDGGAGVEEGMRKGTSEEGT